MRPALLIALGLALTGPATAGCLIFCDPQPLAGDAAEAWLARELGQPLPAGIAVGVLLEGGFQDRFVQIRLSADAAGRDALLALLDSPAGGLAADDAAQRQIAAVPGWDLPDRPEARGGPARFGAFAQAHVWIAPGAAAGRWDIWLIAFET